MKKVTESAEQLRVKLEKTLNEAAARHMREQAWETMRKAFAWRDVNLYTTNVEYGPVPSENTGARQDYDFDLKATEVVNVPKLEYKK